MLVVERFSGGGATALSGGVVYAGGGTKYQRAAGVDDTPEQMYSYLGREVGDAVSPEVLRSFCDGSVEMLGWLESNGVPFEGSLCPKKTSYPSNEFYLYYSGSESSGAYRDVAAPAPRGHRAKAPGNSGKVLFTRLADSARAAGVRVLDQTRAESVVTDAAGRVVGVNVLSLRDAPARIRRAHRRLSRYSAKPGLYVPQLRKSLQQRIDAIERRYARPLTISARRGVVLTAGRLRGEQAHAARARACLSWWARAGHRGRRRFGHPDGRGGGRRDRPAGPGLGVATDFVRPLTRRPYSLIDISVRPNVGYPCPMLTLGGLVVRERTGAVLSSYGAPVPGLYAAGRTAIGICSNAYVSGLSLADCVFSGRRAGKFSARIDAGEQSGVDRNKNVF